MDALRLLGFDVGGAGKGAVKHLRALLPDEKKVIAKSGRDDLMLSPVFECLFPGSARAATLISESGFYRLVLRSDKPEARAVQDWVMREVLPSIRKHGVYVAGQENMTGAEVAQVGAGPEEIRYETGERHFKAPYLPLICCSPGPPARLSYEANRQSDCRFAGRGRAKPPPARPVSPSARPGSRQ